MTAERVSPFGSLDDFTPAPAKAKTSKPVDKAAIEQVAADNGFPSRQAAKKAKEPVKRQQRRHTTGRNQQINLKATPETVERFYALADAHGVTLAKCFELALDALSKAKK